MPSRLAAINAIRMTQCLSNKAVGATPAPAAPAAQLYFRFRYRLAHESGAYREVFHCAIASASRERKKVTIMHAVYKSNQSC